MKTATVGIVFALGSCLATLLTACGGGGEETTTYRIAFSSSRGDNFDIYVMNADGSGQTALTNNPWRDISPAWSP